MNISAEWMDVIIQVVEILLGLVVTVGIPYLFSIIKKKTNNETTEKYLNLAESYLKDAVKMTNQTFVNYLKETKNFGEEEQRKAFEMAKQAWIAMLSEEARTIILNTVGDIDEYLNTKIEAMVYEVKQEALLATTK